MHERKRYELWGGKREREDRRKGERGGVSSGEGKRRDVGKIRVGEGWWRWVGEGAS